MRTLRQRTERLNSILLRSSGNTLKRASIVAAVALGCSSTPDQIPRDSGVAEESIMADGPHDSGPIMSDRPIMTTPDVQTTTDQGMQSGVMAGWRYCRTVTITGDAPAGHVHDITVPATMLSNFSNRYDLRDARVLEGECGVAGQQLPIYVEYLPGAADRRLYVKALTANTHSLALYYGNGSATNVSDGNAVFDFFEGFNSAPTAPRWEVGAGTPTLVDSAPARDGSNIPTTTLAIAGTRAGSYIRTSAQFSTNKIVEFRAKFTGRSSTVATPTDGLVGLCADHSMLPLTAHALDTYVAPAGWRPVQGSSAQTVGSGDAYVVGSYHVWTITRQSSGVTYQIDRSGPGQTISTNVPTGDMRFYAIAPNTAPDPNNPNVTIDWVTVRGYVAGMNCAVGPETTR